MSEKNAERKTEILKERQKFLYNGKCNQEKLQWLSATDANLCGNLKKKKDCYKDKYNTIKY